MLYARMGGYDGIARLVDTAFPRVAAHPQLRRFFQGHSRDSQTRQRQRIVDILCAATGGPCLYTGAPMPSVHSGLGITADDWRVFMQIISTALDDLKVPDRARRDLVELFERRFRAEVVEKEIKPASNKGETPMGTFKVHTIESAPEASKPLLAKLQSEAGFIPNLAATMAESPALLDAFTALRTINGRTSSLSPMERELVSIAVAREYDCSYCVAAHSTFAIKAGAAETVVAEVRDGRPTGDKRIAVLTKFARGLVQNAHPSQEDVSGLLAAGIDRRQIFDIVTTMAQVALASQTFLLAGAPLDAAFEARAWGSTVE
jgi:uncharacterized peroxidase-related enzyme